MQALIELTWNIISLPLPYTFRGLALQLPVHQSQLMHPSKRTCEHGSHCSRCADFVCWPAHFHSDFLCSQNSRRIIARSKEPFPFTSEHQTIIVAENFKAQCLIRIWEARYGLAFLRCTSGKLWKAMMAEQHRPVMVKSPEFLSTRLIYRPSGFKDSLSSRSSFVPQSSWQARLLGLQAWHHISFLSLKSGAANCWFRVGCEFVLPSFFQAKIKDTFMTTICSQGRGASVVAEPGRTLRKMCTGIPCHMYMCFCTFQLLLSLSLSCSLALSSTH